MKKIRVFDGVCGFSLMVILSSCSGAGLYELPAPAPEAQRRNVSLIPGEDERREQRDFDDAKKSLLALQELIKTKRFEEALDLMSQETVSMLEFVSPDKKSSAPAVAVFTLRKVVIDGVTYEVKPLELLLAKDLSNIQDTSGDDSSEETESSRRRELFAQQKEGDPVKIVMIKEGDTWLLHRTKINPKK